MRTKCHTCQIKGQLDIATLFRERCQFSEKYYCTHYMASHYRYIETGEVCESLCCYRCNEKDLCGYACNACKKIHPTPQFKSAPRHSWEYYGIDKKRYNQLTEYIRSGIYAHVARQVVHTANKEIAEYLVMSIEKDLSYDDLERMWTLGEIERIPVGRSDFYGWRRYFYHLFDLEVRRIGK